MLHLKNNKVLVVTIISLVVILISLFFIRPAIIGYGVYRDIQLSEISSESYPKKISDLELDVSNKNYDLEICRDLAKRYSEDVSKYMDKLSECEANLKTLELSSDSQEQNLQEELENLQKELDKYEIDIGDLNKSYSELVNSFANNLCCKEKVDNPNIRYYFLENNKIICSESGSNEISC